MKRNGIKVARGAIGHFYYSANPKEDAERNIANTLCLVSDFSRVYESADSFLEGHLPAL